MAKKDATASEEIKYDGCYGPKCKATELRNWIIECAKDNFDRDNFGRFSICAWGAPGIGKTAISKSLQNYPVTFNGKKYDGFEVRSVPLAQIEEMGDVLGLPTEKMFVQKDGVKKWILTVDAVLKYYFDNGWIPVEGVGIQTVNSPQSWVPTEERPGIILFDDGNRASQRIMKGLMQLVQDYRTISWELPKGWTIMFTGNPDNRFNNVTSMDSAQLTRMKHVTMEVDAKEWVKWATENQLDSRGVNFILRYPEMLVGRERTNPRTLSELFYTMKKYKDFKNGNREKFIRDAYSLLDDETVTVLTTFMNRDVEMIIEPEMILEHTGEALNLLDELMSREQPRVDIVSITNDRLIAYLGSKDYKFQQNHVQAVQKYALCKSLPRDISYGFLRVLLDSDCKQSKNFVAGNLEIIKMMNDCYKIRS